MRDRRISGGVYPSLTIPANDFNVSYKYNEGFQQVYIKTTTGREVVRPAVRRWFYNKRSDGFESPNAYLYTKGLNWGMGDKFHPPLSTYLFTEEEYQALVDDGMPDMFERVEGHYNT